MISNEKMGAEKCGELKLKTDFLATFGQPKFTCSVLDTDKRSAFVILVTPED